MNKTAPDLPLRDIHVAVAPPWWPPAPGWWLVAGLLLLVVGLLGWWWLRRRRRQRALAAIFDQALQQAVTPAEQLAAMSELLRRASRRHDRRGDTLQGQAWLQLLDQGMPEPRFSHGPGRILADGPYRPDVLEADVQALRPLARQRFLLWMGAA